MGIHEQISGALNGREPGLTRIPEGTYRFSVAGPQPVLLGPSLGAHISGYTADTRLRVVDRLNPRDVLKCPSSGPFLVGGEGLEPPTLSV